MKLSFPAIFFLLILQSCSFHSSQYDFLKQTIIKSQENTKPKKNWSMFWMDQVKSLYAVNFDEHIVFADEDVNIFFHDGQIYKITGLMDNDLSIKFNRNRVIFFENNKIISSAVCTIIDFKELDSSEKKYIQTCSLSDSNESYINEVSINKDNKIFRLKFKIHPYYPSLELKMN